MFGPCFTPVWTYAQLGIAYTSSSSGDYFDPIAPGAGYPYCGSDENFQCYTASNPLYWHFHYDITTIPPCNFIYGYFSGNTTTPDSTTSFTTGLTGNCEEQSNTLSPGGVAYAVNDPCGAFGAPALVKGVGYLPSSGDVSSYCIIDITLTVQAVNEYAAANETTLTFNGGCYGTDDGGCANCPSDDGTTTILLPLPNGDSGSGCLGGGEGLIAGRMVLLIPGLQAYYATLGDYAAAIAGYATSGGWSIAYSDEWNPDENCDDFTP